jgi:hypothetical protein
MSEWVKYKDGGGPRFKGTTPYRLAASPVSEWDKILGVVARCEGCYDTVVMYDGTGVTAGFVQWTFTSGRLQKFFQSLKGVAVYDFTAANSDTNLFDSVCCDANGRQLFEPYGFYIKEGSFIEAATKKVLTYSQKNRINDVCMGRTLYKMLKEQRRHALGLCDTVVKICQDFAVGDAQVAFAKQEFKQHLTIKRAPLGKFGTIANLLDGTWGTPLPAVFFNLWINNPGASFTIAQKAYDKDPEKFFNNLWGLLRKSKFGNWGFGKPENKSPRCVRIQKAIKEFYGISLSL